MTCLMPLAMPTSFLDRCEIQLSTLVFHDVYRCMQSCARAHTLHCWKRKGRSSALTHAVHTQESFFGKPGSQNCPAMPKVGPPSCVHIGLWVWPHIVGHSRSWRVPKVFRSCRYHPLPVPCFLVPLHWRFASLECIILALPAISRLSWAWERRMKRSWSF
jgi:hypothetical protein